MPFIKHTPSLVTCLSPEHNPPTHVVLPAGTHVYLCPECKKSITIQVDSITF